MGGGGNPAQPVNNQEIGISNQLMEQWVNDIYPYLQKTLPELYGTISGQNTPLMQAAQAPVTAQTQRLLRTMQQSEGSYANPNALMEDIATQGQQSAGLAADQTLAEALQGLMSIFGIGQQGVGMGLNALGNVAGNETQWGEFQAQNNPWNAILGGIGEYYGMRGSPRVGTTTSTPSATGVPSGAPPSWPLPYSIAAPVSSATASALQNLSQGGSGNPTTPSTPFAQLNKSYRDQLYRPPAYGI